MTVTEVFLKISETDPTYRENMEAWRSGKDLQKKCLAITSSVTPAKLCCCILIIFILVALNVATLSALLADSENWTLSQISCTSVGAVLAQFETEDELNFLTRYKDIFDYWIGLSRESSHHAWKWTDNSKLNAPFVIQGTGECAYLTDSGVSSGKRYVIRKRICSKTNSNVSISLNTSRPF
ncbi:C-type lectin domain family 2 member D11-like isoform X2 [Bubalus kerabau]|uniref:C-type lectin domain family 2 member D11-like isoform X2 n=1 Tax=Bubalus carabanensis TaxID=3119969 RepID=UPI00244ED290|nr:C-type lectin domain family 2 member D11-like isoform X2 [Bubalus carabanensis]